MTPQEKAEELVDSYRKEILRGKYHINGFVIEELSQECALIAADEVLKETSHKHFIIGRNGLSSSEYWQEVKSEIEAL
jgi:hypothetical protein